MRTEKVSFKRVEEQEHFTEIVFCFLKNLRQATRQLDVDTNVTVKKKQSACLAEILFRTGRIPEKAFFSALLSSQDVDKSLSLGIILFAIRQRVVTQRVKDIIKKNIRFFKSLLGVKHLPFERWYHSVRGKNALFENFIGLFENINDEKLRVIARKIVESQFNEMSKAKKDAEDISSSSKRQCILISRFFRPTWSPTFDALKRKGWISHAILHHTMEESQTYGICAYSEIPADNIILTSMLKDLIFLTHIRKHPILLDSETYTEAAFEGLRVIMLFLISGVIAQTVRECRKPDSQNLFYLMYDAVKAVSKDAQDVRQELSKFYFFYMSKADKIIFNSNDKSFGEYIENSYGITCPKLHFPRYSDKLVAGKKRLSFGVKGDEFHVVCISACLNTWIFDRVDLPWFVKALLEQEIHFHYYGDVKYDEIGRFLESLTPHSKKYLHLHPTNRDQTQLLKELHQYHIGFNPSDYLAFSDKHKDLQDRPYHEALCRYYESTYPTSALTYAAAGLPVLIPSGMYDLGKFLNGSCLSILLSEVNHMREFFKRVDLKAYCERADQLKERACINTHIDLLDNFIGEVYNNPSKVRKPSQKAA